MPPPHTSARALDPIVLLVTVALSVLGAIVGLQILTTLGVTPNTSLIGVIIAIGLAKTRVSSFARFRSVHVQNLVQTAISSATFGAANSLLLPIGVPVLIGRSDLVPPMLVGAAAGMFVDLMMLYGMFDSRVFPGSAPWPQGRAAAEAILAGDEGGRRRSLLAAGAAFGVVGASGAIGPALGRLGAGWPMSAFGVAFIGNAWALAMFALGLLTAASAASFGVDLMAQLLPHGMMVGAGLAALGQALWLVRGGAASTEIEGCSRSRTEVVRTLALGLLVYLASAAVLALLGGLWRELSWGALAGWVVFAAVASIAAQFIVGLSAMHAGWFPAFATALVFLVLGLAAGFPPASAALLVGFVAAGGPAFADAGYDFKAGWHLRAPATAAEELAGRRQQLVAGIVGLTTALCLVTWLHPIYFSRGLFAPVDRVYAATIASGIEPSLALRLLMWAVPGAMLQLLGGPSRQIGVLFSTGLLIANPHAGWAVAAGLVTRAWLERRRGVDDAMLGIAGAGCIAGDAVFGACAALVGLAWSR